MAEQADYIDVTQDPELLRIAEEVRATQRPRVLRRDHEDIAVIAPIVRRRGSAGQRDRNYEAFVSSFGSWSDLDTVVLKRQIKASRGSRRPPIEL
ncbi:MAG TPA: hypothetical protein VII06_05530 [Chloroflexota bacterium]|jgi:hypothetical protein